MAREDQVRKRFVVRGRVQGVGFRWFVQRAAVSLGVAGWARNCDDGSVEVIAAGSAENIARLRGQLWQGPSYSRVEAVEESETEAVAHDDFRIVH